MNFVDVIDLQCKFSGILTKIVPARYISAGSIGCTTPGLIPGEIKVTVSINGVDDSHDGLDFFVYPMEFIEHISPTRGVINGGTSVSVIGGNFMYSAGLSCSFGGSIVPASYVSETKITCFAPNIYEQECSMFLFGKTMFFPKCGPRKCIIPNY